MSKQILLALLLFSPVMIGRADDQPVEFVASSEAMAVSEPADQLDVPSTVDPAQYIEAPLMKSITWEFSDMPLEEMMSGLTERIDVQVYVHTQVLADNGIPMDEPVAGHAEAEPAYLLLDRVFEPLGLAWYIDEGILNITSMEDVDERLVYKTYAIGKLLDAGFTPEVLDHLLREMTPGSWFSSAVSQPSITFAGTSLLLNQTIRVQRETAGLLLALQQDVPECYVNDPPSHRVIRQRLKEPISVHFAAVPLNLALSQLEEKSHVRMEIAADILKEVGVSLDQDVSLQLEDQSLESILRYLLSPIGLAAISKNGVLRVTTAEDADGDFRTVVHNVRDICPDIEDTKLLADTIYNGTNCPWGQVGGIGGSVMVPISGVVVVINTEMCLDDVRGFVATYRQAVLAAKHEETSPEDPVEMAKIETRQYHMNADTAIDLQRNLPSLIKPGTWHTSGVSNASDEVVGKISVIRLDPKLEQVAGRLVFMDSKTCEDEQGEKFGDNQRSNVLVIPQASLVVTHTRATHQQIGKFLDELRTNQRKQSGYTPGVSFGGGFFNFASSAR